MMRTPKINMTYVAMVRNVRVGEKIDTDVYKGCNEIYFVQNGETTFAGYAVPWSGLANLSSYDMPINLYYSDDKIHILGFQTSSLDDNGRTYSFMA